MITLCKKKDSVKEHSGMIIIDLKNEYNMFEYQLASYIKAHRLSLEISYPELNWRLSEIATSHSLYMAENGIVNHDNFTNRVANIIYKLEHTKVGECVAYGYGTPEGVLNGLLKSKRHRAIIEKPGWTQIGVSVESDGKRNYITVILTKKE